MTIALVWSATFPGLVNALDFAKKPVCLDCGFPRGVPFTLNLDATFNSLGGSGYVLWTGVIADAAFVLVGGVALGWLIYSIWKPSN